MNPVCYTSQLHIHTSANMSTHVYLKRKLRGQTFAGLTTSFPKEVVAVALSRFFLLCLHPANSALQPSESLMLGAELFGRNPSHSRFGLRFGLYRGSGLCFLGGGLHLALCLCLRLALCFRTSFRGSFLNLGGCCRRPDELDSELLLESWLWESWLRPGASSSSSFCSSCSSVFSFLPRCFAVCSSSSSSSSGSSASSSSSSSSSCSCSLSSFFRLFPGFLPSPSSHLAFLAFPGLFPFLSFFFSFVCGVPVHLSCAN